MRDDRACLGRPAFVMQDRKIQHRATEMADKKICADEIWSFLNDSVRSMRLCREFFRSVAAPGTEPIGRGRRSEPAASRASTTRQEYVISLNDSDLESLRNL